MDRVTTILTLQIVSNQKFARYVRRYIAVFLIIDIIIMSLMRQPNIWIILEYSIIFYESVYWMYTSCELNNRITT